MASLPYEVPTFEHWSPTAVRYHPLQAGSIDGTDVFPHDKAIRRALSASYRPNKKVSLKTQTIIYQGMDSMAVLLHTLNVRGLGVVWMWLKLKSFFQIWQMTFLNCPQLSEIGKKCAILNSVIQLRSGLPKSFSWPGANLKKTGIFASKASRKFLPLKNH